jgi:pSer/pThr/pTyr-binding forkhead associated (FHA) protein
MAAEYWCEQGLEITVEGPEGRFCVKVEKPFARIGHHESSEVVLPDKDAPRRGVYLHATEAGVFYVHLASSPSKNGEDAQGWLATGQILNVGQYRIGVQLANGQAKPDASLPDFEGQNSLPPHPVLMVVDHGKTVAHHPLRQRFSLVGRDQHNTLQLADSQISTSHCVLYREENRLWAIDLLSSNGTSIAGQPLESALVAPGQSLSLGDHVELVYLSNPPREENLDELTLQVTSRMIQFNQRRRRRRRLLMAAIALLVLLAVAATVFFLPKHYLENLREYIPLLWNQDR